MTNEALKRAKMKNLAKHFVCCKAVLDVGAGEGGFLFAARGLGIDTLGIDRSEHSVGRLLHQWLPAVKAEAITYLRKHAKEYDGFMFSNVIEHMGVDDAKRMLNLIPSGARVVITTANAECLDVMLKSFWSDLEHKRPYTRAALFALALDCGILVRDLKYDENTRPQSPLRSLVRWVRSKIVGDYFGPPEIYIVGEKV